MKIIDFRKKEMKLLTKKQQEAYENMEMQKYVKFVKKNVKNKHLKDKNIIKSEIIVIMQGNIEVLHIAYVI